MKRSRLSRKYQKLGRFARLKKHIEKDIEEFAEKHPAIFYLGTPIVAGTGLFATGLPIADVVGAVFVVGGGLGGLNLAVIHLREKGYSIYKVEREGAKHRIHVIKKEVKK